MLEKIKENSPISHLNGKSLAEIERATMSGVIEAHKTAGVPIINISVEELNEEILGELLYFFMTSSAVSAYLMGVNPFNQPGVESYKQRTFDMLK